MTSSYRVDPKHELVLVRPTGVFSETEFLTLLQAIYDDPERAPHFSAVWDTRSIDELAMGLSVISMYREFLRENDGRLTDGKIAIVTSRSVARTFASMLIRLAAPEGATYRLFERRAAAAEWLGCPPDALSPFPGPTTGDEKA